VRLLEAAFVNRTLSSVHLNFVHHGGSSPFMTIMLTNAFVGNVHRFSEGGEEYDEVSLVYQRIVVTWLDPNFVTQDDPYAPAT
jgi:type VI protein secretion system component Hcp